MASSIAYPSSFNLTGWVCSSMQIESRTTLNNKQGSIFVSISNVISTVVSSQMIGLSLNEFTSTLQNMELDPSKMPISTGRLSFTPFISTFLSAPEGFENVADVFSLEEMFPWGFVSSVEEMKAQIGENKYKEIKVIAEAQVLRRMEALSLIPNIAKSISKIGD